MSRFVTTIGSDRRDRTVGPEAAADPSTCRHLPLAEC
jgi:hypothetical protein